VIKWKDNLLLYLEERGWDGMNFLF
jgi:hypothetical protein